MIHENFSWNIPMKNNEIWTTTTTIHKPKANALYRGVIALFVHYDIYISMRCVSQPSCLLAFYCTSPLEPIHTLQKLFSLRRQPKVKRNKTNFFLYATKYLSVLWWNRFELNSFLRCVGRSILWQSKYVAIKIHKYTTKTDFWCQMTKLKSSTLQRISILWAIYGFSPKDGGQGM